MSLLRTCIVSLFAASLLAQAAPKEHLETWPDGKPKARYVPDAEGRMHGVYEEWAQNGTRTRLTTYVHGRRHGVHKQWTEHGVRVAVLNYADDLLHGLCETFHSELLGTPKSQGNYRAGQRIGKWTESDAAGDRVKTSEYRDGKLHGTVRVTLRGKQLVKQTWRDGFMVQLDELQPFPVAKDTLLQELRTILATPAPPTPAAAADPKAPLRHEALLRLRAYRRLCGVAHEGMELVAEWNDRCDAASEVCRKNGEIDHFPLKPPGFDDARFQLGAEGARHSNLAIGSTLPRSVDQYMDDSDPSNIDRVGHRRWCLNPAMKKTGFGTDDTFHAMWSMDSSGSASTKGMDAVCYPPRGYVPVDLFGPRHAFSIGMLSGSAGKVEDLAVSIRAFDADWIVTGEPLELDHRGIAGASQGTSSCLVFRPKGLRVEPGSSYLVEVSLDGGKTHTFRYVVAFCEPVQKGAAKGRTQ